LGIFGEYLKQASDRHWSDEPVIAKVFEFSKINPNLLRIRRTASWIRHESAPRSPWQRAYVERVIGSMRRECLDHVIDFNETGLRRMLSIYFSYYHETRPHLALEKDSPKPRRVQPPELGQVVEVPQVGRLHHRYERRAA
jgi:hypothetical protein